MLIVATSPSLTSNVGTYHVNVNSVMSPIYAINAPSRLVYPFSSAGLDYNVSNVKIVDPDDDAYTITVGVYSTVGSMSMYQPGDISSPLFTVPDINVFGSCLTSLEDGCTVPIYFWSSVTNANNAIAYLYFSSNNDVQNISSNYIGVVVYKVPPTGTTSSNYETSTTAPFTSKSIKIQLTNGGFGAPQSSGLQTAVVAGGSAIGIIFVFALVNGVCYYRRKQKHHSKSAHAVGAYEDPPKISFTLECCWEEVPMEGHHDEEGLADHRASNASLHSTSKGQYIPTATAISAAHTPEGTKAKHVSKAAVTAPEDSLFEWEKHIDKRTGDIYFYNPKTGVSQWDPPTVKMKRTGK